MSANYFGGGVTVYTINADGSLSAYNQLIKFTGSGPDSSRQSSPHPHAAVFSQDGAYLFVPDLGTDQIRVFDVNEAEAEPLTARADFDVTVGDGLTGRGPRHFVFSRGENYAYLVEEPTGTISVYSYSGGSLALIQRIDAYPDGHNEADGRSGAAMCISNDGRFLYTSNRRGADNIAIFEINQINGQLSLLGHQDSGGGHPASMTLDATSKYLIVANRDGNNIVVFSRNADSGLLGMTSSSVTVDSPFSLRITGHKDVAIEVLDLGIALISSDEVSLSFPTQLGILYDIYSTSDLNLEWPFDETITGDGDEYKFSESTMPGNDFYQVRRRLP